MKVAVATAAIVNAIAGLVAGFASASPIVGMAVFLGVPFIVFVVLPLIICSYALRWTKEVLRHGRETGTHPSVPGILGFLGSVERSAPEASVRQLRLWQD